MVPNRVCDAAVFSLFIEDKYLMSYDETIPHDSKFRFTILEFGKLVHKRRNPLSPNLLSPKLRCVNCVSGKIDDKYSIPFEIFREGKPWLESLMCTK